MDVRFNALLHMIHLFAGVQSAESCPIGWFGGNFGTCYYLSTDKMNWSDAQTECQSKGGYMVEVGTAEENDYMKSLMVNQTGRYWIGLTDEDTEGNFSWAFSNTSVSYEDWAKREPNDLWGEDCVHYTRKRQWNDNRCRRSFHYICEACPPGWVGGRFGTCYYFSSGKKSWRNARIYCQSIGGDLVEVSTSEENAYVKSLMPNQTSKYWMGLTDVDTEGNFTWASSNTSVSYEDWAKREPNDLRGEDCVHYTRKRQWNDNTCRRSFHYICEESNSELVAGHA